jgi:hypothetical protein
MRFTLVYGLALVACRQDEPERSSSTPAIHEHEFKATNGQAQLTLGASCEESGGPSCKDGYCLRTRLDGRLQYVCTRSCADATACPAGWTCSRVALETGSPGFCVPGTTGGKAQ